ncbi:hypothetical protein KCP73_14055 [Salmonella enterica subsp. enterica]|nr:hypothetical protein KCP73_14055 [Salmonella enterica subsp. enterica]
MKSQRPRARSGRCMTSVCTSTGEIVTPDWRQRRRKRRCLAPLRGDPRASSATGGLIW